MRRSRVYDAAAQVSASVVGRALYLLLQVVLARQLGPFEFGLYCIGWTVVGLVGTLTTVGMPQAVLRFEVGGRSSLLAAPVLIAGSVGLAAAVAVALLADRIVAGVFGEPAAAAVLRAFAPAVFALSLISVMVSSLRVTGAVALSALVGMAMSALGFGITLLAFAFSASAVSAAAAQSVAAALAMVGTAAVLRAQPDAAGAPALRALARFGVITMVVHGSNVLNIWADRLVIGMLADAAAVGVYQVASQLAMVAVVLRSAVVTVFETKVPKQRPGGGPPDVTAEYVAALRLLLHATGPGLIAVAFTAGFWVESLFGATYAAGAAPLVILIVGQIVQTIIGPSVNALHMTGDERVVVALTFGSVALNILGNFALIPLLGTAGAALATVAANTAVGAACVARLVRTGRLRPSLASCGDLLLGVGGSTVAVWSLSSFALGPPTVVQACLVGFAAYAVYFAVLLATCRVEDDVLRLLRGAFARAVSRVGCGGRAGGVPAARPLAGEEGR